MKRVKEKHNYAIRRICSVILSFCVAFTMLPFVQMVIDGSGVANAAAAKGSGQALVEQAEKYLNLDSLTKVKNSMEAKGYTLWNKSYSGYWCAWFVSNCARQAGISTSVIENNVCATTFRRLGI